MSGLESTADVAVPAGVSIDQRAVLLSYLYALAVGLALGHFLLGIPIQLTDSFGNMLKLSTSWADLLYAEFTQRAYLRPMLWAELKLVYDASGGDYFSWFRGTHVVQVTALLLLYVGLVRPRTFRDAALIPFGLAVLVGSQTFAGTIREAFPINTFLTVLLFCVAAMHLALAGYRWWHDILALLLFAAAALTVESGLLVWVILVGAWLVGGRGVSRGGILALVALLAGYFYLRFAVLSVGSPSLLERSSGFGFGILEPAELTQRFGANPIGFYVYNVATSMLSVLIAEPTAGVFRATAAIVRGDIHPATVLNVMATASVTLLLARFVWRRRHLWRARRFDRDDQLVLVFGMVLVANAVISYPYTKDVIMSPAGALFAVAGFVAARDAVASLPDSMSPRQAVAIVASVVLLSGAWATRLAGAHLDLRTAAYAERNDWAYAEGLPDAERLRLNAADRALFETLRNDAVYVRPAPPSLDWPLRALLRDE
jgi:hypothetical protein